MMRFAAEPLTEDELRLRDEVREFMAQERANGLGVGLGINAEADMEFSRRVAARGWVGMTIPKEHGGPGRTAVERFVVVEEMLAAGAPISAHWVGDRQTAQMFVRFGSEEHQREFLPRIVAGDVWFCLGMSEPDSGSDLASVRTRATRTEGGWLLNGQKVWTSGAQYADYVVTLCRTSPAEGRKHVGLSQLLVDLRADGVTVSPIRLLNGFHHFNEVHFDDVFVPDSMVLGQEGDGWHQVTSELAHERSGPDRFLSVMPVLARLYEELRHRDLPDDVLTSLGRTFSTYMTLRSMSLSIARALDRGETPAVEAALVKDLGTQFEQEAIEQLRTLVGGELDPTAPGLEGLLADAVITAPTFTLRGGTNEVLRTVVWKSLQRSRKESA
ncbi:alkylation response protein AidB-like acyl-CoA dehydrogenase [Aeromicrobium tamlense]|uniref:Alkylation response protein AidB-like acyl-CoA dehydrogenase n=2 Tax=Aeromicrobium tamlense TaxID=375541 RepID=A0ABX2SH72_9ACTN|nr:alkylation response protein AidB-like acyl-CoA dehydrogenase [Aeromicrobium tamlense]